MTIQKISLLLFCLCACVGFPLSAQDSLRSQEETLPLQDSLVLSDSLPLPELLSADTAIVQVDNKQDSLLKSFNLLQDSMLAFQTIQTDEIDWEDFFLSKYLRYYERRYTPLYDSIYDEYVLPVDSIPTVKNLDSLYEARLNGLNQNLVVKLPYNQKVKNFIDVYINKKRKQVNVMLALSQYYFPIFEEVLEQTDIPSELKYLAVIESALNPRAVSKAGASGMWQIMYQTGRMYNLKINSYVDERYDPVKSCYVAANYLKDMYKIFGDWFLAIAAYNCGPGNVNRAIRKARGAKDFWKIYPYLPKETRGYVPAFIGATYAMNYHKEHGILPPENAFPLLTDTILAQKNMDLKQVAEVLEVPLDLLRDLNPQYKNDIIPGYTQYYSLRLPVNLMVNFMEKQDSIYAPNQERIKEEVRISYRIKPGDNLSLIAKKFGVSVKNIMKWNHLSSTAIYANKILYIYTREVYKYQAYNPQKKTPPSVAQSSTHPKPNIDVQKAEIPEIVPHKKDEPKPVYHFVREGETLYGIAKKYNVDVQYLVVINKLPKGGRLIRPNQRIKIK